MPRAAKHKHALPKGVPSTPLALDTPTPPPNQPATAAGEAPPSPAATPIAPVTLERYKVKLGVDGRIPIPGPPGELKVWIGDPARDPHFDQTLTTAETRIDAVGQSAKVTPFAPDFVVAPKESICMTIHPSDSEARFALTPTSTGTFRVGADVLMYATATCKGAPVPKSAASLKVDVVVNKEGVAKSYLLQLWEIFWEGVLNFWQWLVASLFGLFVFLIRKHLKKWFGFDA